MKVFGVVLQLLVVVGVVIGLTALLLVLGSLLAHVFAVSVWQASLLLLGVSGGVGWAVWSLGTPSPWDLWGAALDQHPEEPGVTPVPPASGRRRRR